MHVLTVVIACIIDCVCLDFVGVDLRGTRSSRGFMTNIKFGVEQKKKGKQSDAKIQTKKRSTRGDRTQETVNSKQQQRKLPARKKIIETKKADPPSERVSALAPAAKEAL